MIVLVLNGLEFDKITIWGIQDILSYIPSVMHGL